MSTPMSCHIITPFGVVLYLYTSQTHHPIRRCSIFKPFYSTQFILT